MAKELQTATIRAPAFYGINTQESDITLDSSFAKIATNCVLDEGGRLASRKGWRYLTSYLGNAVSVSIASSSTTATVTQVAHGYSTGDTVRVFGAVETEYNGEYVITVVDADTYTYTFAGSATSPATGTIQVYLRTVGQNLNLKGMHRFVDIDGDEYFGAWSDDTFYIRQGAVIKEVTYSGSQTIQDGNWQAVTLNDAAYLFQRGYEPLQFKVGFGLRDSSTSTNTATVTITNSAEVTATNSTVVTANNSGTTATITHIDHGFTTGDTVYISGANETEYNGTWTITVTGTDTYTYTMSSSPSGAGTGTIIANGVVATITHTNHGYSTGDTVYISNSNPADYDGTHTITVVDNDTYTYVMSTTPSSDAIDVVTEHGNIATVTHAGHGLTDVLTVSFSGANESDYNVSNATITIIDSSTYTYVMTNAYSTDATGTITASWTKGTPPEANTVLSAYGRLWAANTETNKTTVYWSDVLDGTAWNTGTAGSLDISSILVKGNDEIVALGAHNGNLIIFCTNNIIIMGDADEYKTYIDPNTLQLVEVIHGIGCIARDSVQNIGDDIIFLSESGIRSIGRTIQEKSQPLSDLSRNVRDDLLNSLKEETGYANIKSVYSDHYAFYLLMLPATNSIYCFDTKRQLETGALRTTTWDNIDHTNLLAYDGTLYMTNVDGIAEYYGYSDNNSPYTMQYYTAYFDFGSTNIIKILKSVGTTVYGTTGQKYTVKVSVDYDNNPRPYQVNIATGVVYEYNIGEYGIAEYSGGSLTQNIKVPVGSSGFVAQLGFESTINGGFLTIQQVDLYVKLGRLY